MSYICPKQHSLEPPNIPLHHAMKNKSVEKCHQFKNDKIIFVAFSTQVRNTGEKRCFHKESLISQKWKEPETPEFTRCIWRIQANVYKVNSVGSRVSWQSEVSKWHTCFYLWIWLINHGVARKEINRQHFHTTITKCVYTEKRIRHPSLWKRNII